MDIVSFWIIVSLTVALGIVLTVLIVLTTRQTKPSLQVQERLEFHEGKTMYTLKLRNAKNRPMTVRDFGLLIGPYRMNLLKGNKNVPLFEEYGSLELFSHGTLELDVSTLAYSSLLQNQKGTIYFYYEDVFGRVHKRKSHLLRRYLKAQKKQGE